MAIGEFMEVIPRRTKLRSVQVLTRWHKGNTAITRVMMGTYGPTFEAYMQLLRLLVYANGWIVALAGHSIDTVAGTTPIK